MKIASYLFALVVLTVASLAQTTKLRLDGNDLADSGFFNPSNRATFVTGLGVTQDFALGIDSRLPGKNPATDRAIYSTQTHTGTPSYIRNPACWAATGELTCVSPWNSHAGVEGGGTLISPRHVLFAEHFMGGTGSNPMPNGTTIRFITRDNQIVERTLSNKARVGATDICIGLLNADVPETISYARVLPSNFASFVSVYRQPALVVDAEEKAIIKELSNASGGNVTFGTPSDPVRATYDETLVPGDSSNPVMLIIGNTPVVVGAVLTTGSVADLAAQTSAANAAMSSLGGGYSLTAIDLSPLVTPRNLTAQRITIGGAAGLGATGSKITTNEAGAFALDLVNANGTGKGLSVFGVNTGLESTGGLGAKISGSGSTAMVINATGGGVILDAQAVATPVFQVLNSGALDWPGNPGGRSNTLTNLGATYSDPRMRQLTAMALVKSVSSIAGVSGGISGATYNPRSATVFVVRNVSGAAGNIYELTTDGALVRTIANSNFIDTEALAWVGYDAANGADVFVVGEEDHTTAANEAQLTLCRLTPGATTLDRVAGGNVTVTTAYSGGNIGNLGLESIAYDSRRGVIYYTIEKQTAVGSDNTAGTGNAKMFQRSVTTTGTLAFGPESELCNINALFTGATLTDISDAAYDAQSDTILLQSDESKKVVRISLNGTLIEQLATSAATQPEGLAIHPDGTQLFVAGEPQEFFRYQLGIHRGDSLLNSRIYPTEASSLNAQTGTTYTLLPSDNGKVITLNNAAAISLTVPTGLPIGFSCRIIQLGAGLVTVSASGTTVNSFGGTLALGGQYAAGDIQGTAATNTFVLIKHQ